MNPERQFHLICDEEGCRLDVYLSKKLSITRTKIKNMIEEGHIRVSGTLPKSSTKIKRFTQIDGTIPEEEPLKLEPQDIPLDILYEDDFFLAVNKPGGMVVHPSFGHSEGTLVNAVLAYLNERAVCRGKTTDDRLKSDVCQSERRSEYLTSYKERLAASRPGIVHRLDKDTTGVILVAKDSKTQEMLSALFKDRHVHKTYRAVVEDIVMKDSFTIEGNIGRHPVDRKKMAVLKDTGRQALTYVKVIERLNGFSYIEAYPKTGRTHQIRVHLMHTGHPIVGDATYGRRAKRLAKRLLLHAYRIEFMHPVTNAPVLIEAPVPYDIEEFIKMNRM